MGFRPDFFCFHVPGTFLVITQMPGFGIEIKINIHSDPKEIVFLIASRSITKSPPTFLHLSYTTPGFLYSLCLKLSKKLLAVSVPRELFDLCHRLLATKLDFDCISNLEKLFWRVCET